MKQSKIIIAYNTIEQIKKREMVYPSTVSYALFKTKKALQDQYDFQSEEETKLLKEFNPEQGENGNLKFKSNDEASQFLTKLDELGNLEVKLEYEKQKIKLTDDLKFSVAEIEALDDFIVFEE